MDGGGDVKPAWLRGLLGESFFVRCDAHEYLTRHEKNIYCLQCTQSLCPNCFDSHSSHPLLQVRRYVYHDVGLVEDLVKLIDCTNIQQYTINGAKAVFLNQRPQPRHLKGCSKKCLTCGRNLQGPFSFCSLSCKVEYVEFKEGSLTGILRSFDPSEFTIAQLEGLEMEDQSEAEAENWGDDSLQPKDFVSTCSTSSSLAVHDGQEPGSLGEKKEKKKGGRKSLDPGEQIVLQSLSRRKSTPTRSPFS